MKIISSNDVFKYEDDFVNELEYQSNTYKESFLRSLISNKSPFARVCFDEMAVLYIHNERLFSSKPAIHNIEFYEADISKGSSKYKNEILRILSGDTKNKNQVLKYFSLDSSDYISDIQAIIYESIDKYGKDEWVSCVLTSELHRHLGIYALIGTKMGIRAREYFGAGVDEMKIVSYAGSNPPFSCLNDGLQVSTGATIGHGLISLSTDSVHQPKADFYYLGQKITLSLKKQYAEKIKQEVKELNTIYGLDSNTYWDLLRINALNYWKGWDRHEIFSLE